MIVELVGLPGSGKTTLSHLIKNKINCSESLVLRENLKSRYFQILVRNIERGLGDRGARGSNLLKSFFSMEVLYRLFGHGWIKGEEGKIPQSMVDECFDYFVDYGFFSRQMKCVEGISRSIFNHRVKVIHDIILLRELIKCDELVLLDEGLFQRLLATQAFLKQHYGTVPSGEMWKASKSDFYVFLDVDPDVAYERSLKREKRLVVAERGDLKRFFYMLYQEIKDQMDMVPDNMKIVVSGEDMAVFSNEFLSIIRGGDCSGGK
jgi:thymidylate kinase